MFDTEKFILEVEKRPPLYDVQSKEYSNRNVKAQCWMEVGAAVHDNWEEMTPQMKDEAGKDMMKKWKTLRDNFVRELRILKKNETGAPATKKRNTFSLTNCLF
ncbi:uncharacterized protein LOC124366132 [Homalodisca vitripennis]|uniref:uncharacterized protein LOC124366132 n=1 Tax=Homalodisca vitripennis TaxID=197043 RepID=UPI001EEA2501|nr:uncharacterized protein LOC124366132 [Homalodisca vitripennis]KAG8269684.1 hypothetical protein J6590_102334 [Homalodisca vitripennis]KAG8276619.1 hypothetical protein J6590_062229 [Homalodisca vitripennis]